jgi:hypothetical protein
LINRDFHCSDLHVSSGGPAKVGFQVLDLGSKNLQGRKQIMDFSALFEVRAQPLTTGAAMLVRSVAIASPFHDVALTSELRNLAKGREVGEATPPVGPSAPGARDDVRLRTFDAIECSRKHVCVICSP